MLETLRTTREAASGPEVCHNTAAQQRAKETILEALLTANRVLVRRDGHVPPLSPLYNGPYAVLRHAPRFFTLWIVERDETVHVQRGASSSSGPPLAPLPPRLRVRFTLPPHDQPAIRGQETVHPPAEEPGPVFPSDASEGFFVRPGSFSTDTGRPQHLRRPPLRMDL